MVSTTAVLSTTSTPRDTYFRLDDVEGRVVEECVSEAVKSGGDFWMGRNKREAESLRNGRQTSVKERK